MRIFNKMKKTMLVLAASLFCANVAFADTQTVYSWESPDGTAVETGGTIVYTNGDGNRLNYPNDVYYTICLNGKSANINDETASKNAGHMVLTLNEALQTGDVITITAYRNKDADGKSASIYFLFENGVEWKDSNSFVNICANNTDNDYDDDGSTPNSVTWTITDAEAGSKTVKLTRNSTDTNLFITKMTITREAATTSGYDLTAYNAAVAAAEAYKATLNAEDETDAMAIEAVNEYIANAAIWLAELEADPEATQADVDLVADDLNNTIASLKSQVEVQKLMAKVQEADAAGQEALAKYPEETRTDNAGLVIALRNLPRFAMGYTAEQIQEAIDAVYTAIPLFEAENAPVSTEVDVTSEWVVNPTVNSDMTGWTSNTDAINKALATNKVEGNVFTGSFLENWTSATLTGEIYQEIANLPAGEYKLQMGAFAELQSAGSAGKAAIFANEASVEVNTLAPTVYTVAVTLAETATLKIGMRIEGGANWVGFDNVKLLKVTTTTLGQEQNALAAVLGEVEALKASYADVVEAEALDAVVASAKNTSVEECKASVAAIRTAMDVFKTANDLHVKALDLQNATAASPKDASFLIDNANFDNQATSWEGSPSVKFSCGEKWNTNFDVYQILNGVPNGYYKVSVQGFYRAGWGGTTGQERHAMLYAGEVSTPLVNILTEAGNAAITGDVSDVAGYGVVPNDMASASGAFGAGLYAGNSVIVEVTDGTLRIGVKKDTQIDGDWTIFDSFQLTYYGTEVPPVIEPGAYYMKNVGADKFLLAANSWGTQASLGEKGLDMQVAFANGKYTFDSNVSNGGDNHYLGTNGYMDSGAAEWTLVDQGNGTFAITADGVNYIGYDGSTTVLSITLTDPASANAQWQFISKAEVAKEVLAAMSSASSTNPVDATYFIQGQGFNRNDGRNSAWQGGPTFGGGSHTNWCAEKWNANFDIYQDLAELPNGYYKVSAQGFYRAGNGGATAMDQNAYLYADTVSVPLMNINAHAGDPAISGNTSNVEGLGVVPNNMETAGNAFTAGLYADNSVMVQVTNGTLRIGVKKDVLIQADWTIFDNFQLTYYGAEDPTPMITAVDSLNTLIAEAEAWQAELNPEDEMHAMVLSTLDAMIPAAKAVAEAPASVDAVNGMIFDVYSVLGTYKPMVEKYDAAMAATAAATAAEELIASYENPIDNVGLALAIASVQEGIGLLNDMWEPISIEELNARVEAMKTAQALFVYQNVPAPTATVTGVINGHRIVELACDHVVDVEIFYSLGDEAMATKGLYTAPFMVSETTTVYAYAQFVDAETRETFKSAVAAVEIEAGTEVALNAPVIEETAEGVVITSDQSDVLGAPVDTIVYEFYPVLDEEAGTYSAAPSVTGTYTEALALAAGKLIAKAMSYGYTTSVAEYVLTSAPKVAYLCGATETTEAIYTALVNSGLNVTPMNYDEVSLTDADVEALAAYDLVVLAGNTGSGTNLAKTANLLVGKVNVLSTKSFWYKHYGTNGSNPGTADAPSLSLVKTVAAHPIFEGIEGDEFAVFNDMAKETGRYLQGNGSFNETVGLTQTALATANGTDCIGEGWLNGYGYVIIPVDGVQPEGYLTAEGEALFANVAWYLINGEQYVDPNVTIGGATGIEGIYADGFTAPADIYDVNGRMVKKAATSLEGLQKGLYLINGKKVLVK